MISIEEIATLIKRSRSAVVFTHMRPDGDTIGSGLALCRALRSLGMRCEVVNEGEIPERYTFLAGTSEILQKPSFDAEAYIAVDTSDLARLGALEETFRAGLRKKVTFNIDHHVSNPRYAKYNFVRERSSNCETIAELIRALGVIPDRETADFLMLGMVTDSGNFSHSDVNEATFLEAAYAARYGADVNRISYEAVKRQTKERATMYAEVISKIRFFLNDALAVAVISQEMLERYGLKQDASEGVVDFALTIDSVEVSICLLEAKRGQFKASLRSKGKVNVNEIAKNFGGGGHVLASGCMLFGDLEEILDRIRYTVYQNMGDV